MNWDMETNYLCPSVVHHPTNNNYVHLSDCPLPSSLPSSDQSNPSGTKLNEDQTASTSSISEETRFDSINHNGTQIGQTSNSSGSSKQNFPNVDLNGSKVIRLVRAKEASKRKSSLDTLIEVVQKELLRVNGQSSSTSPSSSPPHHSQTRSTSISTPAKTVQYRSASSSILPSSYPGSTTSQSSNHSLKIARKRVQNQNKRLFNNRNRSQSNNHDESINETDSTDENLSKNYEEQQDNLDKTVDESTDSTENIEDIVRDTVDKLVAITLLNNAPFIVNMLTAIPGNNSNNNVESKPLTTTSTSINKPLITTSSASTEYFRNDLALLSSTASDIRNSMQQASPVKHQPATPTNNGSFISTESVKAPSNPTVFVAPRVLNFQTVVPKPTTNINIGNTKIILVPSSASTPSQQQQSQISTAGTSSCLVNSNPIKLVKFTPSSPSTFTLPKNVQIVLPKRTSNESLPTSYRPLTKLATCAVDQIPQAAQEVTITTSPPLNSNSTTNKPRRRSSTSTPTDKPVGKILRPIAKVLPVYSSNNSNSVTNSLPTINSNSTTHEEMFHPMTLKFSPALSRSSTTHGPMIYQMTSVNSSVPVFRVRANTSATTATIKSDVKPISLSTTTGLTYESKPIHSNPTAGSVSVLAYLKTTKKRNKERAIMPRPSATDVTDTSQDFQQRLTTNSTVSTANGSFPSTDLRSMPVRLLASTSTSMNLSEKQNSAVQTGNEPSLSLSNRVSATRSAVNSFSSSTSFTEKSSRSHRPTMEDKGIQCIDDDSSEQQHQIETNSNHSEEQKTTVVLSTKKRVIPSSDDSWTAAADTLLRNVLSQYGFRFLDVHCQQSLSLKFDSIQAKLVSGMIPSPEEFYKSVVEIKQNLLENGLSKISADSLEKLFHHFEIEYPKIYDGNSVALGTNERKRARRQ